jgi:predicted DsbA family dithiol-disulfide isomerase
MTIEIYSDIACPWCYIGEKRFSRALGAFAHADEVEVVFKPYQLDPTLSEIPRPLAESLRSKFGERLDAVLRSTKAAAKSDGLDLRFEDALAVNTLTAHRLLRYALEEGGAATQRSVAEKLFDAHFTRGMNVADHDVLADLAGAAGLDRDATLAYLASDDGKDEVVEAITDAQRLGITAVPTLVIDGRFAIQGAQPPSEFLRALEEIYDESGANASSGAT